MPVTVVAAKQDAQPVTGNFRFIGMFRGTILASVIESAFGQLNKISEVRKIDPYIHCHEYNPPFFVPSEPYGSDLSGLLSRKAET